MRSRTGLKSHCLPRKIPIYEDNYLRAGTLPNGLLSPLYDPCFGRSALDRAALDGPLRRRRAAPATR